MSIILSLAAWCSESGTRRGLLKTARISGSQGARISGKESVRISGTRTDKFVMLRADHVAEGACYTNIVWRRMTALRMLGASYRIFKPTSVVRRLDTLAGIDLLKPRQHLRFSRVIWSLDPPVLDAIRIATCFENLFKARLLMAGCIIHEVDKKVSASLQSQQRTRPILIREIKKAEHLLRRKDNGYCFQYLLPTTLRWHTLIDKPAYRRRVGLPARLFDSLKDVAVRRNTLHFLALEVASYNSQVFDELRYIRASFNTFVVGWHNRLLKKLGFADRLLLEKVE